MKKLIAGNWKMNLGVGEANELIDSIVENDGVDILVSPIYPVIPLIVEKAEKKGISVAAQNCYSEDGGAYTGEVPAGLLKSIGCSHVIIGHSERRSIFGESNEMVESKSMKALERGLIPIICIGESEEEREKGVTNEVLESQLDSLLSSIRGEYDSPDIVIAYEPVWAIGTGKVPDSKQIGEAHKFIRELLIKVGLGNANIIRILYGGSMKPNNAMEILDVENVDGGLIGGASLKAEDFNDIVRIASEKNK